MTAGIVLVGVAGLLHRCYGGLRSSWARRAHFNENRAKFEELVRMSNEDFSRARVIRIAPDFTRLEDDWGWPRPKATWGIDDARWDQYRKLFHELELPVGLVRSGPMILFPTYTFGIQDAGHERGILWSTTRPPRIDNPGVLFTTEPLEKNWYLYEDASR